MISTHLRCMAIVALLLISCLSFSQETTYYENDRLGFSLSIPDSWTVVDEDYEQVSFLSSEEMQNDEDAPGAFGAGDRRIRRARGSAVEKNEPRSQNGRVLGNPHQFLFADYDST